MLQAADCIKRGETNEGDFSPAPAEMEVGAPRMGRGMCGEETAQCGTLQS